MRYRVTIEGVSPLIHNNLSSGLDTRSPAKLEIAEISKKRGSNRTVVDDQRLADLEAQVSLYLDDSGRADYPASAVRAMIEGAARKTKQGGNVREGLVVESCRFIYDEERYGTTPEDLGRNAQFTVPVKVQQARVLRTRARFDLPWSLNVTLDCDDELIDAGMLERWLDLGGRRIGLGDWRPACSGQHGRFKATVEPID